MPEGVEGVIAGVAAGCWANIFAISKSAKMTVSRPAS